MDTSQLLAAAEDALWLHAEPLTFDALASDILPDDPEWRDQVATRRTAKSSPTISTYAGFRLETDIMNDRAQRAALGFDQRFVPAQTKRVLHAGHIVSKWYDDTGWQPPQAEEEALVRAIVAVDYEEFESLVLEVLHGRAIEGTEKGHPKFGADGFGVSIGSIASGQMIGASESTPWPSGRRVVVECKAHTSPVPKSVLDQVDGYLREQSGETKAVAIIAARSHGIAGPLRAEMDARDDLFGLDAAHLARLMLRWKRAVLPGDRPDAPDRVDIAFFRKYLPRIR